MAPPAAFWQFPAADMALRTLCLSHYVIIPYSPLLVETVGILLAMRASRGTRGPYDTVVYRGALIAQIPAPSGNESNGRITAFCELIDARGPHSRFASLKDPADYPDELKIKSRRQNYHRPKADTPTDQH